MSRLLAVLFVLLALQFMPGAGVPEAVAGTHHGVTYSCLTNSYNGKPAGCTREIAYAQCEEVAAWYRSPAGGNKTGAKCQLYDTLSGPIYSYEAWYQSGGAIRYFNAWVPCPEGTTWDEVSKKCFDPQQCLAKPPLGFTKVVAATSWDHVCSEGCQFTQAAALDIQFPQDNGTVLGFTTGWKPNGQACLAGDPSPVPATSPQQCLPAPAGQTFCIKSNGDHCYSASTGRQICWKPGETGEKASGPVLQSRTAGSAAPAAPQASPPPGDSFSATGAPTNVAAIVNGSSVVTTVVNFITGYGTSASGGTTSSGGAVGGGADEPSDGSGAPSGGGSGDGNGDGTASGGSCAAGWVCGGDEVACAILSEEHQQRCASESLRDELMAGAADYGPEGDPEDAFGASSIGDVGVDDSGFLAASDCPVDTLPDMPDLDLAAAVCPGANVLAIYVLLLMYIHCAHIMGRAAAGGG